MPTTKYKIVKKGNQFCVADNDTGMPIHGGKGSCHMNRPDAVKQLRAIYANSGKSFNEKAALAPVKNFSSMLDELKEDELPWIQVIPYGFWPHPVYTDTGVSKSIGEEYVKNFKENVRRQDLPVGYEHGLDTAKGDKAAGWFRDMELREDGIYAQVEFTPTAKKELHEGEWKYFSLEFLDVWDDAELGVTHENVVIGGTLTNKPYVKDMVPINFSEAVLEEPTTKFRFKDGKWIASDDDGESWRIATKDEHADLEHSEPGTGSPPQPREDEDDKSGDKDDEGIRRDSPPPQDKKEGSEVELAKETLVALGLPEDATAEAVNSEIQELIKTVEPLKKFHEENKKAKKFAEEFPSEAEEMAKLRKAEDDRIAKQFSERYERIVTVKGEGENTERVTTSKGFSGLVLSEIEGLAKKFSEGTASITDLQKVLDAVSTDKAIVDYGEVGSGRTREDATGDGGDARKLLSEKASAIIDKNKAEGKEISYGDALSQAMAENPDLTKAYSEAEAERRKRAMQG